MRNILKTHGQGFGDDAKKAIDEVLAKAEAAVK